MEAEMVLFLRVGKVDAAVTQIQASKILQVVNVLQLCYLFVHWQKNASQSGAALQILYFLYLIVPQGNQGQLFNVGKVLNFLHLIFVEGNSPHAWR